MNMQRTVCRLDDMRAWYSGRASAFQADDTGSIPVARSSERAL